MKIWKRRNSGWLNYIPLAFFVLTIIAGSSKAVTGSGGGALHSPQDGAPGSVTLEVWGGTAADREEISLSLSQSQGGWEQRFEKVYDTLDLYVVVDSKNSIKITWPDRGFEGRNTWSSRDPAPETRSIARWVGNGSQIHLRAVIKRTGPAPLCYMDTIYNGNVQRRWELTADSEAVVTR